MLDIIKRANIAVIFGWWSISDLGFRVRRENGPFPANTRRSITPARAHIGSRILPLSDRSWIIRTIHQEAYTHTLTHRFRVNYPSWSYVLTRYSTNARLVLSVISRYLVFSELRVLPLNASKGGLSCRICFGELKKKTIAASHEIT